MENKVQVKPNHYKARYLNLKRFISYYYQTKLISECNPKSILEIGVGNGITTYILRYQGYKVTTFDFDPDLKPDITDDIRNIDKLKSEFDVVCAFETLEHLPFNDFEPLLQKLNNIVKDTLIISIPYANESMELILNVDMTAIKKQVRCVIRIPHFRSIIDYNKNEENHYWELGTKGYSLNKVKRVISKYFIIEKSFTPALNNYHHFFVLKKKA